MIRISQIKLPINHKDSDLVSKICKILHITEKDIEKIELFKKSVDAREKPNIKFVYTVDVYVKNENRINKRVFNSNVTRAIREKYAFKPQGENKLNYPPVVIGMGPGGLFAAYLLALYGYRPIVLERGRNVESRKADVDKFWEDGKLNLSSNVQFGEGGAGTFSDGKLNTMVKDKNGRNGFVLETFHKFGASDEILYTNKPHIGTDVLARVVKNMREEIIRLGGEVRFEAQVTNIIFEKKCDKKTLKALEINNSEVMNADVAILAIGHSARDTFQMLADKGFEMEAKNFAVGIRIQHPQEMIDKEMYGFSHRESDILKASDYKLTGHAANGRNVFSFCMCPGGYVVNASSEENRVVINGMSYSGRDSENANSAIIVSVTKEDYPGNGALSGVDFQRRLEETAFSEGEGNIPVQLFGDFKENRVSTAFGEIKPCIKGKYSFGNIKKIFPKEISDALQECIDGFSNTINGFNRNDAILAGVESRTSSPVRILRNEGFESNIAGVYPCGEGAGYAGGITSAAIDGIKVFEAVASKYENIKDSDEQ
ncbi:MAG: FAD-dependent oxidoreductase [Lachnospiraceae bacterium]|nr:FAD-dependent oxidoreductase [Lachnospiraceae bacterium]